MPAYMDRMMIRAATPVMTPSTEITVMKLITTCFRRALR